MHLTDQEAAARQADRENRLTEYARRKRNNLLLVIVLSGAVFYVIVAEVIADLMKRGVL
ncbi:hypothetical protein [Ralstonia sp. 3PA37C10]|jgi:hypothetical protein|uniref:hypothetical protein n=1 Tax=unclassified Ralstonia TaxID=209769 RepID=UPI001484F2E9|nr:hypothetical protein [Ralstonia sp. 3PA37C10]